MENFSTSWLRLILGDILLLAQRSKRREAQVDKNLSVKPGGPNIFSIQSILQETKFFYFTKPTPKGEVLSLQTNIKGKKKEIRK
jgi:hypothetical protein